MLAQFSGGSLWRGSPKSWWILLFSSQPSVQYFFFSQKGRKSRAHVASMVDFHNCFYPFCRGDTKLHSLWHSQGKFYFYFFLLMTWTRFKILNLNFRTILSRGFQNRQLGILESAVSVRQSLDWGMWTTINTRNASRNLPRLSKLEPVTILGYFLTHLSLKNYRIVYDLPSKAVCAKWEV